MGIKDLLKKVADKFGPEKIDGTLGKVDHISDLTNDVIEAVSGEKSDLLASSLTAGTKAALAAAALAGVIAPAISGPIAASAFLGASLYKLYKGLTQKAACAAIENDGLTPVGKPISNGLTALQRAQSLETQRG